ncbi:putative bifunctional diguanylate cyclase/phosphodiesterase [Mycolicibacterium hodleri]|nr:bifunctional diguanylate cyclase/phosphodiesterase [Mycolicibacterium hodleri]
MASTTGGLFFVSGSLGVVLATQMPDGPPGDLDVVFALAAAAVLIGIGLVVWGHRLRPAHHHALVAGGTIILTATIYESTSPVAAVALASLYISVAIDVCVFFNWLPATAHMLFAVTCCLAVFAYLPDTPWWAGLVASGATVGVGVAVGLLSRLASDAHVDALTGLPNRRGFDRALSAHVAAAERHGSRPALVVLNLDRFHAINDKYGYRSGDEVLQLVVRSWLPVIGPEDVLARPGGDRFALLLPDGDEHGALALVDRLRATISQGCSAGVTAWQPGDSASFLVSRADAALYRAKLSGANRTVLEPAGRVPLKVELTGAITNGEIEVVYQPIMDLTHSGTIAAVEALLRWAPPSRPDTTTVEVIRAAEESGLISELDQYVLRRACSDAHALQRANTDGPLTMNVNVSSIELATPGYVDSVATVLRETGWQASQLVLEVTESVLDVDTPLATDALRELRRRGIRIAIDDFGTGYSSLSRIQTLPTDLLKLDRSFVSTITPDAPTPPLLRAIAILAIALELPVVAEGVEDEAQAETVKSLGYSFAQGFHYGRPQSLAEMIATLGRLASIAETE